MGRRHIDDEDATVRSGLGLLGAMLLASAVLCAEAASGHMAALGSVCGGAEHPHCAWCYGAAALTAAGISALIAAVRPARAPACARSKQSSGKPAT